MTSVQNLQQNQLKNYQDLIESQKQTIDRLTEEKSQLVDSPQFHKGTPSPQKEKLEKINQLLTQKVGII